MEGDGLGHDWVHAFTLHDESLSNLMGSQIPNEPHLFDYESCHFINLGFSIPILPTGVQSVLIAMIQSALALSILVFARN
jgi:hypothetical protein